MALIDTSGLEPYADLIKEMYGDLAKPGVQNVGVALSAVLGLGVTLLWPIMWANERAKIALENNLEAYRERLKDVPPEEVTVAPAEVAMPIIEKLSYVTNEELKKLYIELLAKASIKGSNNQAHPSFVNIINNLSPDEAKFIEAILPYNQIPFIKAELKGKQGTFELESPILRIRNLSLTYEENIGAYISNLVGVGLIQLREDVWLSNADRYKEHMEYFEAKKPIYDQKFPYLKDETSSYHASKGIIQITKLGDLFFKAVYS